MQLVLFLGGKQMLWLQALMYSLLPAVWPRYDQGAQSVFMLQPPAARRMLLAACRQAVPQHALLHYAALAVSPGPLKKLKHL